MQLQTKRALWLRQGGKAHTASCQPPGARSKPGTATAAATCVIQRGTLCLNFRESLSVAAGKLRRKMQATCFRARNFLLSWQCRTVVANNKHSSGCIRMRSEQQQLYACFLLSKCNPIPS